MIPRSHKGFAYSNLRLNWGQRRDGFILIAVLGFIFLMAVFVTQLLEVATLHMRVRAVEQGRHDLRSTAYSGMELALAVLSEFKEIDDGLHRPSQGWGDPAQYARLEWPEGTEVRVTISDESGKIPLRESEEARLREWLREMDIDFTDADIMVDSLLDWMDADDAIRLNGAEDRYYEAKDPPLLPANGPVTSLETLRHIRGFDEQFFDEDGLPRPIFYLFAEAVSLHHEGAININTVPPPVLAVLAARGGFDAELFKDYLDGVDRIAGTDDDNILRSSEDLEAAGFRGDTGGLGFSVTMARINVEVSSGDRQFSLSALVGLGSGGDAEGNADNGAPATGTPEPGRNTGGSGQNSAGNAGGSSFKLLRLVENAQID